jgi:PAS domain S-box-containing protein
MEESRNSVRSEGAVEGRRCRSLIQNSFDVFKIVDAEGKILFASPSVERVMGYRPDELVGTNVFEWIHPDDAKLAQEAMREVLAEGELRDFLEVRDRNRDGTYRVIEVAARNLLHDPAVRGIVLNYRDITERKHWEDALRESEARYQMAFRSSPDSITISFLSTGVFLEVNEGFQNITGYSHDEIIGKSALALGIWVDEDARSTLAERLQDEAVVRNFETTFRAKDGSVVVGLMSATVIELHGTPCMLATVRDVTKQKRAEEELRKTTEQLQREHRELTEKNIALKQILDHIEDDKTAYRHEVAANVENLLRPIITRLEQKDGRLTASEVDILESRLNTIIKEDIDQFQNNLAKLTPRELDICELIQKGKTSKEIADDLGLSPETIHKHRQAIRRKLQIDHRGINLSSYLRSR